MARLLVTVAFALGAGWGPVSQLDESQSWFDRWWRGQSDDEGPDSNFKMIA